MAPKRSAAKGKAKGKAKAQPSPAVVARRQARLRRLQLVNANRRQLQRRAAVATLNKLADELLPADTLRLPTKTVVAADPRFERLVRALQPRCQTRRLAARLREATRQWADNGGALSQPVAAASDTGEDDDDGDDEAVGLQLCIRDSAKTTAKHVFR